MTIERRDFNRMIAAAVGGVLAGSLVGCGETDGDDEGAGPARPSGPLPKHACKGLNECKGQGGCMVSKAGCKAQNDCRGQGGCATVDHHACGGKNTCKGLGGCKSGDNGCKAKNTCDGKGGCAVPIRH